MSTSQSFKNLTALSQSISATIEKLNIGNLNISEVQQLLEESRELHERVAILQYVLNAKNPPSSETKTEVQVEEVHAASVIDSKVSASLDEVKNEPAPVKEKKGFKLNFNLFTSEPEPTNQINLLDVIEEEAPLNEVVSVSVTEVIVESPKVDPPATTTHEVDEAHTINKVIAKVSEKQAISLNEKLAETNEKPTLAAKLSRKPIKDLNEEIGLNQKFLFMNDLFGGENTLYKEAIAAINGFASYSEAEQLMNQLAQRHNWEMESTSVTKFMDLVERRFI
jgi:hypothetical protein